MTADAAVQVRGMDQNTMQVWPVPIKSKIIVTLLDIYLAMAGVLTNTCHGRTDNAVYISGSVTSYVIYVH